ncbi:MAG: exodeoxyribonuclease VII large subunit [Verrucomicrobia bacterium]|nr:exodeoxyribonuclease VII large subunit [Verrucomicrobiota bacterium]
MKKKMSSQWDFNDLFSLADERKKKRAHGVPGVEATEVESGEVSGMEDSAPMRLDAASEPALVREEKSISVAELTARIRSALETDFSHVRVFGEVTNLRVQSSGHIYFSIKDKSSQLQCVLFRSQRGVDRELLKDGREVSLSGAVTVYEARGHYQLLVHKVEVAGQGALQAAFEKLKAQLSQEGLFDSSRKKPLPRFMKRVGLVTSVSGAAIRDVLHVIGRRFPGLEIVLISARVQGQGAAVELAQALHALNHHPVHGQTLDVILLTRGGGSLEDLWAFNEEVLARAIAQSRIPVISAVGHEIDFTIADFVADFRAATPSAAAEVITENFIRAEEIMATLALRIRRVLSSAHRKQTEHVHSLVRRLERRHPRRHLEQNLLRLDDIWAQFCKRTQRTMLRRMDLLEQFSRRIERNRPSSKIRLSQERLHQLTGQMHRLSQQAVTGQIRQVNELETRLRLLSPLAVLERGYAIATMAHQDSQRVVRSSEEVQAGDVVSLTFRNGSAEATVIRTSQYQNS